MLNKFVLKRISAQSPTGNGVVGEYIFDGGLFTIGSDADSTVVLPGTAAEQAVVIQERDHLTLICRAAGIVLNDKALRRESMEPLASGDVIKIGDYAIKYFFIDAASENGINRPNAASVNHASKDVFSTAEDIAVAHLAPPEIKQENKTVENRSVKNDLPAKKNAKNFAEVLNTLRTEEDSFYFNVENGTQEIRRIALEQTEMPIGLNAKGEIVTAVEQIAALYAVLRKDWSGIIIEAHRNGAVFVNDEAITAARRLRNGDTVSFNALRPNDKTLPFLKLHEPSSLVALESLLENRERGASIQKNLNGAIHLSETENAVPEEPPLPFLERRFFGYFNFFEVVSMIILTLIGAVLIFLLLEFFVG